MNIKRIIALIGFGLIATTSPLLAGPNGPTRQAPGRAHEQIESGSLARSDERLEAGEYVDYIARDFRAGDRVTIDLTSQQFDTYLLVRCDRDSSVEFDNDDLQDDTGHSQIIFEAPTTGTYTIGVTSYAPRETGRYELSIRVDAAAAAEQAPGQGRTSPGESSLRRRQPGTQGGLHAPRGGDGQPRLLGLFVGISDYPGEGNDLAYCDQDAVNLHEVMQREFGMRSHDAVVLTNDSATVQNVLEALDQLGQSARPQDTLVFFYSGHGGQTQGSSQPADPDGIHESLNLYDGEIADDEFARSFNASSAGTALVMLDSCFSGGFAKDVVSVDGRMGIFSSEEDVVSMVPGTLPAGGYLSSFLVDALSSDRGRSDLNGDNALTAHELSHYLGERYRDDVRSGGIFKSGTPIDPMQDLSYQRLVVDRGGVGSDDVLFTWR
jgi:hypothetical protein